MSEMEIYLRTEATKVLLERNVVGGALEVELGKAMDVLAPREDPEDLKSKRKLPSKMDAVSLLTAWKAVLMEGVVLEGVMVERMAAYDRLFKTGQFVDGEAPSIDDQRRASSERIAKRMQERQEAEAEHAVRVAKGEARPAQPAIKQHDADGDDRTNRLAAAQADKVAKEEAARKRATKAAE